MASLVGQFVHPPLFFGEKKEVMTLATWLAWVVQTQVRREADKRTGSQGRVTLRKAHVVLASVLVRVADPNGDMLTESGEGEEERRGSEKGTGFHCSCSAAAGK